jgi:perosamine synthetase
MNEIDALQRALASPIQSGKSPLVTEYEEALATHFRSGHAISVNSGSAAIQTTLATLGAGPGKTVLVSAAAPLPSLLPIAATGATPRFVDSKSDSPGMDPGAPSFRVDATTVAALEVPLWGYPIDYEPLRDALGSTPLVEDAAQAHGATISGRFVGTFGEFGCFSTHQQKFLSTGEGGFILTDDPDLAGRARRFARLGGLQGRLPGMNFKISAFTAAVGLARLEQLDAVVRQRRAARGALLATLHPAGFAEVSHIGVPNGYGCVINCGSGRVDQEQLFRAGIETDVHKYGYRVANTHPLFASASGAFPIARSLIANTVQLATGPQETDVATRFLTAMHASVAQ